MGYKREKERCTKNAQKCSGGPWYYVISRFCCTSSTTTTTTRLLSLQHIANNNFRNN
jgi:hypothetical protein